MKILIINGPNLNLLGNREKDIYGENTLHDIQNLCDNECKKINCKCDFFQSNIEGEVINKIHTIEQNYDGLIINPAAYTHTSIAILDALKSVTKPKVEVHLSNIYSRDEYRKKSLTSEAVDGMICGFGANSYVLGIQALKNLIEKNND
tara:strand:+ start:33083 stop:33526 length:444 start_codon:yes stop_codon:yes gene_type:complete